MSTDDQNEKAQRVVAAATAATDTAAVCFQMKIEETAATCYEMTQGEIAAAFNEWMRRYTEEPERFEAEFRTVNAFLTDLALGETPSYGASQATYLLKVHRDLTAG